MPDINIAQVLAYALYGVGGLFALITLLQTFFVVKQGNIEAVERFGKFKRVAKAGINFKMPWGIEKRAHHLSTRVEDLPVVVDTITANKVSVRVTIVVQHLVNESDAFAAFYKLTKMDQIKSFVFDQVRGVVPEIELDDLFNNKDRIRGAVQQNLGAPMAAFGRVVFDTLVTEIEPDKSVVAEMNQINAEERRLKTAELRAKTAMAEATGDGEAEKIRARLRGEGIAAERAAIVKGYEESVLSFAGKNHVKPEEVMTLVMQAQSIEMLERVGTSNNTKVIMIPYNADGVTHADAIRNAMVTANEAKGSGAAPAASSEQQS